MALFNGAQSFYIDPTVVANSTTVDLTSIGMYFMYRPDALANKSGIQYPGITMFVTDLFNGIPNLSNTEIYNAHARCEWNAVLTSSDASSETVFRFPNPISLQTGKSYAFCWAYDGGEDFLPWVNQKGNYLVGTAEVSPGPSSSYGGAYFTFSSVSADSRPQVAGALEGSWTPLAATDAKFNVYVARYAVNSVPIVANLASIALNTPVFSSNLLFQYVSNTNSISISSPSPRIENIIFDIQNSVKQSYVGSQRVYQDTVQYPGGGVWASVVTTGSNILTANSSLSNGAAFSWNDVYGSYSGEKYVVIDYGTMVDVRIVTSIVSNTVVTLDEGTTSANSAARIKISPVGTTDSFNTSYIDGKKCSLVFLRESNANSTVRFVGNSVDYANVAFTNGGTGYSNSDVLYVVGYSNVNGAITSNYRAVANLSTNSTGGVIALNFSNTGAGFVNSAQVAIVVSNAVVSAPNTATPNTSAGSGLVPVLSYSSRVITEQTNNIFRNTRPADIDIHTVLAVLDVSTDSKSIMSPPSLSTIYYLANNALSPNGYSTYVGPPQVFNLALNVTSQLNQLANIPVIASRSNEFGTLYANGAPNDQVNSLLPYSNCFILGISTQSKNDYSVLGPFRSPLLDFGRYIFNNDYTGEHTDSGNALARHITTVFNMSGPANTNQMAEDIRVYISAWRPPTTDIQVYARIQNASDSQAFSDGDWTRLKKIEGSNTYSSSSYTDLTYGFPGQPNTTITLAGTVTTTNASANLVGTGTNWTTSLANNTLVKVYDPLFANNNFAVVLVTQVVDDTHVVVDQVFSTNTAYGIGGFGTAGRGGLSLDVLGFGHQAFNNIQHDNVVRYYNASEHVNDGYNTVQLKCILLSPDPHLIPRIHNIRGIGVSA